MIAQIDIVRFAEAIVAMIQEDQDRGQVPREVWSLDELDESVDLMDYLRRVHLPLGDEGSAELGRAVLGEVEQRLEAAQRGQWHVIWKQPDGTAAEIGRTFGYATKADAESVGREHVDSAGGIFSVIRK